MVMPLRTELRALAYFAERGRGVGGKHEGNQKGKIKDKDTERRTEGKRKQERII